MCKGVVAVNETMTTQNELLCCFGVNTSTPKQINLNMKNSLVMLICFLPEILFLGKFGPKT